MKDKEYLEIIELQRQDNGFVPMNENAMNLLLTSKDWEIIAVNVVTARDLSFHKCYFLLINYIYNSLPKNFQKTIPKSHFHNFLKCLTGQAKIVYEFKELPPLVAYESISFGNMNQSKFTDFVREQLSVIYTELLPKLECEDIIPQIEENFETFLKRIEV